MKNWIKKIVKEAIREETDYIFDEIVYKLNRLNENLESLNEDLDMVFDRKEDMEDTLENNMIRLNQMILELKGIVSVSRSNKICKLK